MKLNLVWLMHVANLFYVISYSVRSILWLRVISIIGGVCFLPYFYYYKDGPIWEAFYWTLVFILINAVHIVILILERRPVNFTSVEQKIFQLVFRSLTPREFRKLLLLAHWKDARKGETIIASGARLDSILMIYEGHAQVQREGTTVATLGPGQFAGEMSFLTGDHASADVVARGDARYIEWNQHVLGGFLKDNPTLENTFRMIIGADLVRKLKSQSSSIKD